MQNFSNLVDLSWGIPPAGRDRINHSVRPSSRQVHPDRTALSKFQWLAARRTAALGEGQLHRQFGPSHF